MNDRDEFRSLVDILDFWNRTTPRATAFYCDDKPVTYEKLYSGACRLASVLDHHGIQPGDRVLISLPNEVSFFETFFGVLGIEGTAVPVFPGSDSERIVSLCKLSEAKAAVVSHQIPEIDRRHLQTLLQESGTILITDTDASAPRTITRLRSSPSNETAFIQFTSGSTADPRGVVLSHRNLLENIGQMIAGMEITRRDIFVSWLPVFHDMGLILMTLVPLFLGIPFVLLPASLRTPAVWLRAIQKYSGTFTAAPDIAYRLCVQAIREPEQFNLSSLRVALNAAEPVRAKTIELFEKKFGVERVMTAGYGLAEATVGVSMQKPGTPAVVDAAGRVAVGLPFPEVEIRISKDGKTVAQEETGEIVVRSPATTAGYLNNPDANSRLWDHNGFLRTGDLGYMDPDGRLYVVSRQKDVIKQAGRSLYPADIEGSFSNYPEIRRCAAVGVDRGGMAGEQLYLFAELTTHRPPDSKTSLRMVTDLVREVHNHFGVRPARVYLIKPHSIPFTPNGKIQRSRLRARYLDGSLRRDNLIHYPDY